MAKAAQLEHLVGVVEALLFAVNDEVSQYRAQLLFCHGMAAVGTIHGNNQNLGFLRHIQAGLLSNPVCAAADNRCENTLVGVGEHISGELIGFLFVQEVAAVVLHEFLEVLRQLLLYDNSLLRSADHAVVEGFGHHEVGACAMQVCRFLDEAGHVARANAQSGFAAAVSCLHHAGAAGCQDGSNAGVIHQSAGCVNGRLVDPLNAVLRCAGLHSCFVHDAGCFGRALLCRRMEAEDDGVAGLDSDQALEHRGGSGVGGRGYTADNAYGLRNLNIAFHLVLVKNTNGLLALDVVPDVLGGEHVLDHLVLVHAAAGFLHSHACQLLVLVQASQSHLVNNVVNLLLIQCQELLQSNLSLADKAVDHAFDIGLGGGNGGFFLSHFCAPLKLVFSKQAKCTVHLCRK